MPSTAWCRKSSAIVLPAEIDDVLGSQVETLATVVNGMNHLLMLPYDYVLILGFGPIGYLFAQFAKNIAAKVAVTEIDPFRISVAKECGLTVWNPNVDDIEKNITDFTYGRKADIVIEATGNAIEQALEVRHPRRQGAALRHGLVHHGQHRPERDHPLGDQDHRPVPRAEHHGAVHPHLPGKAAEHETVLHQGHPASTKVWVRSTARAGHARH